MKWDGNQIISFLSIHEKCEILWNIQSKDMNKLKQGSAFGKLLKKSGFENIDIDLVRTKIKTIKTRSELSYKV